MSRGTDEGQLNLVGQVIAERYRVLEPLTRGGMGAIYRAEHVTIGRPLALKVLRPKFSKNSKVMLRFLQEARVTSQIRQENIIDIIDFGQTPDGLAYLAMELLEGEDLLQTLKRDGPLPWARLGPMVLQICAALNAAHELGVIHRDMKPANCFRIQHAGNPDFIKVLDFGVAKLLYGDANDKPITTAGTVVGTPMYLPPEVVNGASPTPQFDVYALGITMYQLLTGRRPFRGKVSLDLLKAAAFNDPIPPSQVRKDIRVAPDVEAVILQAIHRDPKHRYRSAQALAAAVMETLSQSGGLRGAWASPATYAREVATTPRKHVDPGAAPAAVDPAASGAWTQPSNPAPSEGGALRMTPVPEVAADAREDPDEDAITVISNTGLSSAAVRQASARPVTSTAVGLPPSPSEVASGFDPAVPEASGAMRWRPVPVPTEDDPGASYDRPIDAWSSRHAESSAPRPAELSYAASRSTFSHSEVTRAPESFSASQSTLGVSSSDGLAPMEEPAARSAAALPVPSAESEPAAPGVSRRQLWLILGLAALMMAIGITALLLALPR
ncbi:MAG: protein kinase [Myxococcales bacterium]|nr:protein kinase [Myxococcales bacterium]